MGMIKRINKKKAIGTILSGSIVNKEVGEKAVCTYCGHPITNENVFNGKIVCPNENCPSIRKANE